MLCNPKSGRAGLLVGGNIGFPIIVFRSQEYQDSRYHSQAQQLVSSVNGFSSSQKSRQATIEGSSSAILVIVQAVIAFFRSE